MEKTIGYHLKADYKEDARCNPRMNATAKILDEKQDYTALTLPLC